MGTGVGPGQSVTGPRTYGIDDLVQLAQSAGWSASDAKIAGAIAMAESGGVPTAVNKSSGASGLWQILPSNFAMLGLTQSSAEDPNANAAAAYKLYTIQGWKAWATYTSGAYKAPLKTEGGASSIGIPGVSAIGAALGDFQKLFDPSLWIRVGMGALGAGLIVVGIIMILGKSGVMKDIPPIIPV